MRSVIQSSLCASPHKTWIKCWDHKECHIGLLAHEDETDRANIMVKSTQRDTWLVYREHAQFGQSSVNCRTTCAGNPSFDTQSTLLLALQEVMFQKWKLIAQQMQHLHKKWSGRFCSQIATFSCSISIHIINLFDVCMTIWLIQSIKEKLQAKMRGQRSRFGLPAEPLLSEIDCLGIQLIERAKRLINKL